MAGKDDGTPKSAPGTPLPHVSGQVTTRVIAPASVFVSGEPVRVLSLTSMSGVWIALGILATFFVVAFARNIPDTLARVALGLIFALALDPVVARISRRLGCSRGKAVALVGLVAISLFALVVAVVGPQAVRQAQSFSADAPETVDKLTTVPVVGDLLQRADAPTRIREWVQELPERLDDRAIARLIEGLVGGVVAGLTVLIVGIAVLADGEVLASRLRALTPARHRDRAAVVGRLFYRTVGAYFAGSLLLAALASTFVLTVGLALGVPLAPAAALWVLVVTLLPQIGGFLSASVFTILGLANSPTTGLICLVLYMTYMTIENHVLQPLIIGSAVDMSAAATMLAALVGGAVGGVPGAILATPLVGTLKALYLEIRVPGSSTKPKKHGSVISRILRRNNR